MNGGSLLTPADMPQHDQIEWHKSRALEVDSRFGCLTHAAAETEPRTNICEKLRRV